MYHAIISLRDCTSFCPFAVRADGRLLHSSLLVPFPLHDAHILRVPHALLLRVDPRRMHVYDGRARGVSEGEQTAMWQRAWRLPRPEGVVSSLVLATTMP